MEDLWAFNEEVVARAIFDSEIPIISAVGHEPDVTISDYVADLRAATPSNGAELAVQDQDALRQVLDSFSATMVTCLTRQIKSGRQHLRALSASPTIVSPVGYLNQRRQGVLLLHNRLISSQTTLLEQRRRRFVEQAAKLDAMSPLKVLTRGYAITQADDGEVIRSVSQVRVGQNVEIKLNDGSLVAAVTQIKENCDE